MPSLTPSQIRVKRTVECLILTADTLEILANSFKTPFLKPIANTTRSLATSAQNIKQNKNECIQLMEQSHTLLHDIVVLHTAEGPHLSVNMLDHLGKFTETLHKIHTFVEAQQHKSTILKFFRPGEVNELLKKCNAGLQEALDVFKIRKLNALHDLAAMQKYADESHQKVLEMIKTFSDEASDTASMNRVYVGTYDSSNSISMLPSEPKIFHGRTSELRDAVNLLMGQSPRVAILGAGGMGKTSLARTIVHHPEIEHRHGILRFFVVCETVSSTPELAALIGAHLGCKPGKDLTRAIVSYFASNAGCLLILDNLETVWEPKETRGDIEEFLSLLADVQELTLIVTMRGAEKPAKVRWSRPFLAPLRPLTLEAARKTFVDIADDAHDITEVDQVLQLTDNLPLAIDLMAHLVDSEGFSTILSRWEKEKTSLLSEGFDKRSNLDLSISLSIASPRIRSSPHSQDLLSLLSMLPDGLSEIDLVQSQLPMDNVLGCQSILLSTSLAYIDDQRRLKTLVPVREWMQKFKPPKAFLVQGLFKHFRGLLEFRHKYNGTTASSGVDARLLLNFSNIQNLLLSSLHPENPELVDTIYATCYLQMLRWQSGYGISAATTLMDLVIELLPQIGDHRLQFYVTTQLLDSWREQTIPNTEALIQNAVAYLPHVADPDLEARFYHVLGYYYLHHDHNIPAAKESYETGLSLAISSGNIHRQCQSLEALARVAYQIGDHSESQRHASRGQRLAKISGNSWAEAIALHHESICWHAFGNYPYALSLCNRAKALIGLCGIVGTGLDLNIMNLQAEIHKLKSEYVEALGIQRDILSRAPLEQDLYNHALAKLNIAEIELMTGVPKYDIEAKIDTANSAFKTTNFLMYGIWADILVADLNLREGDLPKADALFQKCLALSWTDHADMVNHCLQRLGNRSLWGVIDRKVSWTTVYLGHALKTNQRLDVHKALQYIADAFKAEADYATANSLFIVALEGFTQMDVHHNRAECLLQLGDISKGNGDLGESNSSLGNCNTPV